MAGQRNSHGKRLHSDYNDHGRNKRRNSNDDRGLNSIGPNDTVYRYLCPSKKIGSIMGKGGDIVNQIRAETKAKIRFGETVIGCNDRVVTVYSNSEETNDFEGMDDRVCPSMDALFKVHDRVVSDDRGDDYEDNMDGVQITVRLLVPADQIGCCIGNGGHIVQDIRSDTGAQIRILNDNHLPACALSSDELVQISGEASNVRKALFQVAGRLHDYPSRSQHLLNSSAPNVYPSGGALMGTTPGAPMMGLAPLVIAYGGYKAEGGEWPQSYYPVPREGSSPREFSLRLICPTSNIGGVIGKGGAAINQIRQETGASIKVDGSKTEGDDCLISISANEIFEDTFSPAIEAALRLQPKCSERVERDSGHVSYTTRLLVPASRIGCLIGKGRSIITEIRRISKANVRIISKEDLPKIVVDDDKMVQISAELDLAKDAFLQITSRLRANLFEREGVMSTFVPVLHVPKYDHRDSKGHGRGHSYSTELPANDRHGSYGGVQFPRMAKKKDASSPLVPGSADVLGLRSGREMPSKKKATASPSNTRNSVRSEKQTSPNPSPAKKEPEKIEKAAGPSSLRRPDRGKKLAEVYDLPDIKSKKEKSANSAKESAGDVDEVKENGRQDPNVSDRKRKKFTIHRYKALFQPQLIRLEIVEYKNPEGKDKSPQANTSNNEACLGVDMELKSLEVAADSVCHQMNSFTEGHKVSLNSRRVQGIPDKDKKMLLAQNSSILVQVEHVGCPSQTKPNDGKFTESRNLEKQVGDNCSPSNKNLVDGDNHISHTSSSMVNHDLENHQERDSCDKVTRTCKAAAVLVNAENDDAATNLQNSGNTCISSKFVPESTPRQRKRPNYFLDSFDEESGMDGDGVKTRRKTVISTIEPAQWKPVVEGGSRGINKGGSGPPVHNESQSSSGDLTAVTNEMSLHDFLKPTVSELCSVLKFSEDVMIIVERFLEFVLENFPVGKEHTSTLQAFMISLCWIGASLAQYNIDRSESFALATKLLNFSCLYEEVDSVYKKLERAKESFLQHTEILDAFKECISTPQEVKLDTEKCQHSQNVDVPENHELSNEEEADTIKKQMEDLSRKVQNEINQFNKDWDEKRANLELDYNVEGALIRYLNCNNPSVRSEKLNILEKEYANKLDEHERLREIHLKDLKATLPVVNEELSFHVSQHETQVSPSLSENSIEAQSHDEPDHGTNVSIPSVTEGDDADKLESTRSRTPDKQMADATVSSKPVGEIPSVAEGDDADKLESTRSHTPDKQMTDATVSSKPVGEIPAQQNDDMEIGMAVADATVLSEPVAEVPAQQLDDMSGDVAVETDLAEMELPLVDSNQEHASLGGNNPDMSHASEDGDETAPSDVMPYVDSEEVGMPGRNCDKENAEDRTISPDTLHAAEGNNEVSHNDVGSHVDSAEASTPADNYNEENIGDNDTRPDTSSHAFEDHNDLCGSNNNNSLSGDVSMDKTPLVQPSATPPSDHTMQTILEIENVSLQIQQPLDTGVQYKDGQVDLSSLAGTTTGQLGQITLEDSPLDPHNELILPSSTDPLVPEIQSDIIPTSRLLVERSTEPTLIVSQSGESLEEHLVAAETPLGEYESSLPSSDAPPLPPPINPLDKQMADATVSSKPIGEIPAQQNDDMEIDMAVADATVLSEPVAEAQQHDDMTGDVAVETDLAEMELPSVDSNQEHASLGCHSPDRSHASEDGGKTAPNDVVPDVDSEEMGMLCGNCDKENAEDRAISPDTSHAAEGNNEVSHNDVGSHVDSARASTPADNYNEENIGDNDTRPDTSSHAFEDHNDLCGSNNNNSASAYVSLDKTLLVQPSATLPSDHTVQTILEIENASLQVQQPLDTGVQDKDRQVDLSPLAETTTGQLGQITLEDLPLDPHNEPVLPSSTDPLVPENQSNVLPPNGLLVEHFTEPTLIVPQSGESLQEHLVAATTPLGECESSPPSSDAPPPPPPINPLDMFDNLNQVGEQMPNHGDPLLTEVKRLCTVNHNVTKSHEDIKQRLNSDCKKEIDAAIAQIRLKYEAKHQEADAALHSIKKELKKNINRVLVNRILAEAFRAKCQNLPMQQESQAGLMQQLYRVSGPSSMRRSPDTASTSAGQAPGSQQNTPPPPSLPRSLPPQPPLQIVHQPAALFSSTPSRPQHSTNLQLPSTTSIRPPPNTNPPILNNMSTRPLSNMDPTSPSSAPTRPPPINMITPSTTPATSRPTPVINTITPSTTPTTSRLPPDINPITPSSTPSTSRPPPVSRPITPSSTSNRPSPSINPINSSSTQNRSPYITNLVDMSAANLRINNETRGQTSHVRPGANGEARTSSPRMQSVPSSEIRSQAPHMRSAFNNGSRAPAPHMRSMANSGIRAPAPHMRSVVGSGIRALAPHIRPFRSTSDFATQRGMPQGQHVTSSLPLASTSYSQSSFPTPLQQLLPPHDLNY